MSDIVPDPNLNPGLTSKVAPALDIPPKISEAIIYAICSSSSYYFIFNAEFSIGERKVQTPVLIDSGATGCFMDTKFFSSLKLSSVPKPRSYNIELVDGSTIDNGPVISETPPLPLSLGTFHDSVTFDLLRSPRFPVILGLPWLRSTNPQIDWKTLSMSFSPLSLSSDFSYEYVMAVVAKHDDTSYVQFVMSTSEEQNTDSPSLPSEYVLFRDVFEEKNADILPQHRPYDIGIDLKPGAIVPFGPIYNLSEPELKELRDYVEENLAKGFIRPSKSPGGAPILFVKKKDGSLRLCVDYRGLNAVTVKNRYPLPLISEIISNVKDKKFFTRIDLKGAYNLVRVKPDDEWKTAFRCRYGHFEYLVMPFGLTNAPATFQHLMNDIFRDLLDHVVIIYLDDILIFSDTYDEHVKQVSEVLSRLRKNNLYASLKKCDFHKEEVEFLGYILSGVGIRMDPKKLKVITSWKTPKSQKEVQIFLGFANFYRNFISNFSRLTTALTNLLKKDVPFSWSPCAETSFTSLKSAFVSAPILIFPDTSKPFILETDASDFAIAGVLSQYGNDGVLHPVSFYSRKLQPAEINYEIHDKELLAIIACFEQWRHLLVGSQHSVIVYTDHKNLVYFTTTKRLNRRQARWSLFLSDFDFVIEYRPGKSNGKPDALSRRPEYAPKVGDSLRQLQFQTLLNPERFVLSTTCVSSLVSIQSENILLAAIFDQTAENSITAPTSLSNESLLERIRDSQQSDEFVMSLKKQEKLESHFNFIEEILLVYDRVYVPEPLRYEVLQLCHDSCLAGHFGIEKTLNLVLRSYWWPSFRKDVKCYVSTCHVCCRSKTTTQVPAGLLKPLPIPKRPWASISLDFIVGLPLVKSYDSVCVIVCRLTKMAHFLPVSTSITSLDLAKLFIDEIFRLHGLPFDIVSDRGPQFVSNFWRELLKLLNITQKLSTAFHPQTDGQTEIVNKTLEQYLRCFLDYQQENWCDLLPIAEFSYNNAVHSSLKSSPFYINYGFHPTIETSTHVSNNPRSQEFVADFETLVETAQSEMRLAQQQQKRFADRHRRSHDIQVGSYVWLNRKNIKTTRPLAKLDYKKYGPFEVIEEINENAFRLKLPLSLSKIHNVFHVSLLELVKNDPFPQRKILPEPPIIIEGEDEYEVDEILDSRRFNRTLKYLVSWKGYGPEDNTWEPIQHLKHCSNKVTDFHTKFPNKPTSISNSSQTRSRSRSSRT